MSIIACSEKESSAYSTTPLVVWLSSFSGFGAGLTLPRWLNVSSLNSTAPPDP